MSPKGQVTIPAGIRRMLGVKPRDKVAFRVEAGEVRIVPARSPLEESYQAIPALGRQVSLEEMEEIAGEESARQAAGGKR